MEYWSCGVLEQCAPTELGNLPKFSRRFVCGVESIRYPGLSHLGTWPNLTLTVPELHGKRAADFVDKNILDELESEGLFSRLSAQYGK
jgi:hypothetical protein